MATYYADFDLGTGNNDGTAWADAWQTMDDVQAGTNGTAPAAGDTVLCRGTNTLSSVPALSASGTAGNPIIYVGVNSSGVYEDGTRAVLDANSSAANALDWNSREYTYFTAFDFLNGTSHNIIGMNKFNVMYDCRIVNAGGDGVNSATSNQSFYHRVQVINSTGDGMAIGNDNVVEECFINLSGTTSLNAYASRRLSVIGTILTNSGLNLLSCGNANVDGCIFNNAGQIAIQNNNIDVQVKNSLFTNMTTGGAFISIFYGADILATNNAFWNNSGDKLGGGATYTIFPYGDTDTALSGDPYADEANDDLTISQPNTDLINISVNLSGNNISYEDIGIGTVRSSGGGGRQPRLRIHGA